MPAASRASKATEASTMTTTARWFTASLLGPILFLGASSGAWAAPPPAPAIPAADAPIGRTPPRLSYVDGEVSFWRPGASNWAPAQVNTPLAAGDETYTGNRGNLELQIGARAFVRAWGDTQLGFVNQEPAFVQCRVPAGHVSLVLRGVEPGRTVEIDTPMAAFTVDAPGYYRVDVSPERTAFITRRSGRATMTVAGGSAVAIAPSEEVVLDGATTPPVQSFVAPPLDVWDSWNYARTDQLIDSMSARYGPAGGDGAGRARAGGILRRAGRARRRGQPVRQLGGARLGRAAGPVVGLRALRRPPVVGGLGRPARRQQRRRQPDDGRQRAEHHRLQQHHRSERGRGRARGRLRPARRARGARGRRRRAPARAGSRAAARHTRCVQLRRRQRARGDAATADAAAPCRRDASAGGGRRAPGRPARADGACGQRAGTAD